MLDIELLREDPEAVKDAVTSKGTGDPDFVDAVRDLDVEWRRLSTDLQEIKTELNERGKEIGSLMREGAREKAQALVAKNAELKERASSFEEALKDVSDRRARMLLELPNLPHPSVPVGSSAQDNVEQSRWGEIASFDFEPRPHWDILESLNLADFARGARVTGAGFPFYVGTGARLQRALIAWFLDSAISLGYTELQAPLLVNAASATATGQLPDKEAQMYEVGRDELFAIPTAEVPVTNFLRDEILQEQELPKKYCCYSPCFRREAGSHGKEVRGLNRLHQFDKVELVQFVHPGRSYDTLEEMTSQAEGLLQKLQLPFRRLLMCTGDMGFTQAKKYDLEVWSPGQARWLEVSSISNFEAFQARRADIRFREDSGGKPQFVHTLNGSALALPRTVAALLETYQTAGGAVVVPEVLRDYMGVDRIRA